MKRPYQITGVLLILFAAFIAHESLRWRYYTDLGPGPGFFPLWLAVLLGLLGAIMLFQATFGQSDPMPEDFYSSRTAYTKMGGIVLALLALLLVMEPLGFRLTALLYLLFMMRMLGPVNLGTAVTLAVAGSLGIYYVFSTLLKVPLPMGTLGI